MQRVLLSLLTALAVVVLPSYLAAEEGQRPHRPRPDARPERPDPAVMFQRLDAKAIFARLDKDKDGKLSFEEFCVGLRRLRQAVAKRAQMWQMPLQMDMVWRTREKMPAFGPEIAKRPKHPDGTKFGMGPWRQHGMKFGMGPCCPCGMHFRMGPWGPHGMQFGMGPWGPHGMQFGMGPWRPEGKAYAKGPWRPDGKKWAKGHKRPRDQKPKAKKPDGKKPAGKVDVEKRIIKIEARLTALERKQAAVLAAIQEQQAAMMAALQKTNKLVSAKLASLGRQHEQVRPQRDKARIEQKVKELAKAGRKATHREKKPADKDRD